MNNYAQLLNRPCSLEWAKLRDWAAGLRDHALSSEQQRRDARLLVSILDSCHDWRERHPHLSEQLWQSALLLSDQIALPKEAPR